MISNHITVMVIPYPHAARYGPVLGPHHSIEQNHDTMIFHLFEIQVNYITSLNLLLFCIPIHYNNYIYRLRGKVNTYQLYAPLINS